MEMIFDTLGRLVFSRSQRWQQRKHARTLVFTLIFALVFGGVVGVIIHLAYNQKK